MEKFKQVAEIKLTIFDQDDRWTVFTGTFQIAFSGNEIYKRRRGTPLPWHLFPKNDDLLKEIELSSEIKRGLYYFDVCFGKSFYDFGSEINQVLTDCVAYLLHRPEFKEFRKAYLLKNFL